MNRDERRALKKQLAPIARKIAICENQIAQGIDKEKNEAEITALMEPLTLMEMIALQDYIESKGLLNNFDHNNKK